MKKFLERMPISVVPVLALLSILLAGLLWHLGDVINERNGGAGGQIAAIGGPFQLTDQNNMRRTDKDFLGKYMLVYFGYTYCPDVCPTTLAVMSAALDKMGSRASRVVPIFISVDPKRDTPEILKAYVSAFGDRFVGLTGSSAEIAAAAKAYKVYYKDHTADAAGTYTVDHSSVVYLMDTKGHYLANYLTDVTADKMAADLSKQTLAP